MVENTLEQYDVISDIHLDFWVKWDSNLAKVEKNILLFIQRIIPKNPSKTLIIAGDLGHYNKQNVMFLKKLKEYYEHIILVGGNHDFYMISGKIKNKYRNNSIKRWNEMKSFASEIEGIHYLDGEIIEIEGTRFGGTTMWYDFSYAKKIWHDPEEIIRMNWWNVSNDSRLIGGLPFQTLNMFEQEKEKLENLIDQSDVLITHVGPDFIVPSKFKMDKSTSFYFFDGNPYIDRIQNKTWIFGHTHERYQYEVYDCQFINASLGYPNETDEERKIITIQK